MKGKNDIVIDGQQQQSVQIYKCENAVITVSGKVTSISIGKSNLVVFGTVSLMLVHRTDASKKVGIIFEK